MMDYELKMPDLSAAADEVTISEWLVKVGDRVKRGEYILTVETDKAQMEVESAVTGRLKQMVAGNDQTVAAGQVIAIFEVDQPTGAQPTAASFSGPQATDPTPPTPQAPTEKPQSQVMPSSTTGHKGMFERNRLQRNREGRGNA